MELRKYEGTIKKWEDMLPGYCGYMRMYFRNHSWFGSWFQCTENIITETDLIMLNTYCREIAERWPEGCNDQMITQVKLFEASVNENCNHHLLEFDGVKFHCLVFINLEYGNADYPIRLHAYRKQPQ